MSSPTLLAIPNISEGRSEATIAAVGEAFVSGRTPGDPATPQARLLDVHSDADHHRSVFTLVGRQGALADALLRGIRTAVEHIDVMHPSADEQLGQHPHVGAVDVVPLVYLDPDSRGAACAEALVVADRIGHELQVPVFLYGELTADGSHGARSRAELRRGGVSALQRRITADQTPARTAAPGPAAPSAPSGPVAPAAIVAGLAASGLSPDFGPSHMHHTAGATLVAARPPLVAFNLQLAPPAGLSEARRIAALVREGGAEGLPGLRAIGISLRGDVAQVSMNVERPFEVPLAVVVEAVRRHAKLASAELVGLAPAAALEGFPDDLPMPDFDPARHVIENALGSM